MSRNGWLMNDGVDIKLTDSGKQLMTEHLLSKKAASLIDGLRVSVEIDVVGKYLEMEPDGMTDTIAGELAAYISELESIKAARSAD